MSLRMTMTRLLVLGGLFAGTAASGQAQQEEPAPAPAVFTPPQAYPVDRYEAAWSKNPFTLKTAPAVVENISFAKDLAIVSHYGDKANPTIVIVNTKTHERTRLKQGETASNGMKLLSFKLGQTRKETTVEVVLGSETTELKYNSEYMGQMAASGGGGGAKPAVGVPGNPSMRPGGVPIPGLNPGMNPGMQQRTMPGANGAPPKIQLPNGAAARPAGVTSNIPQQQAGGVAMGGVNNLNATVNGTNNINVSLDPGGNQAPAGVPLVSGVNPDAPPPITRRRLLSTNEQVLPQ